MDVEWESTARRTLPPQPPSVAAARRLVHEMLLAAEQPDLLDDAELLVSEVVTNALVHAGTPFEVFAHLGSTGLRVEVADGSPQLPVLRDDATLEPSGRGLHLLDLLAERWGFAPTVGGMGGKQVWFELAHTATGKSAGPPRRD